MSQGVTFKFLCFYWGFRVSSSFTRQRLRTQWPSGHPLRQRPLQTLTFSFFVSFVFAQNRRARCLGLCRTTLQFALAVGSIDEIFWLVNGGKQKFLKNFYYPFLPLPGVPRRANPCVYWVFSVFPPHGGGRSDFPRPTNPPARWRTSPAPSRAQPAARGREESTGSGCCHGLFLIKSDFVADRVGWAYRPCHDTIIVGDALPVHAVEL